MNIKRKIHKSIKAHLNKKEITLITGSRQVGKTTIMQELCKELKKKRKKYFFFNLDFEEDFKFFESQSKLLQKLKLEVGIKNAFVFIDEIQRKKDAGLFLKGLFDKKLPYKFIVSGSGTLELKAKIQESLFGRKRVFEVLPITFKEFVNFKTNYKYENKLKNFFALKKQKLMNFYLNI